MSLASQVQLLATRIATEIKSVRALTGYPSHRAVLWQAGSVNLSDNVLTYVPFDSVYSDPNNEFAPTDTQKINVRIPVAGMYRVHFRASMNGGASSSVVFQILRNQDTNNVVGTRWINSLPDTYAGGEMTEHIACSAGDSIQVRVRQVGNSRGLVVSNNELRPKIALTWLGAA